MKHLLILIAFLLTSCASIGLNIGSDTVNNINNGTINVYATQTDTVYKTRTDTVYHTRTDTVIQYISTNTSSYSEPISQTTRYNYDYDYGSYLPNTQRVRCGRSERLNEETNTCVSKPEHSSWVGNSSWYVCDDGYYTDSYTGKCEAYDDNSYNPYKSSDLAHADLMFQFGFGMFKNDSNDYYGSNINLSFGGDFYLKLGHDHFMIGLVPAIGYYYSERSDIRVHSARFELGFKLSVGGSKVHGYMMLMVLANLGNSIQNNSDGYMNDDVTHVNGIEFGVRCMNWENIVTSFYMRVETPMLPLKNHDDDSVFFTGIRIGV